MADTKHTPCQNPFSAMHLEVVIESATYRFVLWPSHHQIAAYHAL
jgi:hypothetical protein